MTLLDGQIGKQSRLGAALDSLMDFRRLVFAALITLVIFVVTTPAVFYFGFAYFTAKTAPWWVDALMGVWALSLFLGCSAFLILGLAKFIGNRED